MDIYEVTTDYVEYLRKVEPKKILKNRTDIGYIKNATPDFSLLEEKCEEYQKTKI